MLWTIIAILFALWLLGLIAHVGGGSFTCRWSLPWSSSS
jgi:hypothetical protein